MPDLDFKITGLQPGDYGMTPLLNFTVEVTGTPETEKIHTVTLQAQIQIQSPRRAYTAREKEKLTDIFGPPDRWGQTLRAKLWTHATTVVRAFSGRTTAILSVPCTFDLNVMATKYFYALDDGDIPLLFLFSGSIFYEGADGRLQVQQISWNKESPFRLPVKTWRDLMDHHYPDTAWLTLNRETFDRLYAFRREQGFAGWNEALGALLYASKPPEVLT
jgi:hypothetical protein